MTENVNPKILDYDLINGWPAAEEVLSAEIGRWCAEVIDDRIYPVRRALRDRIVGGVDDD